MTDHSVGVSLAAQSKQIYFFAQKYLNYDWNWLVYQKTSKKFLRLEIRASPDYPVTCEIAYTDISRTQSLKMLTKYLVIVKNELYFHVHKEYCYVLFNAVNYFLFTLWCFSGKNRGYWVKTHELNKSLSALQSSFKI